MFRRKRRNAICLRRDISATRARCRRAGGTVRRYAAGIPCPCAARRLHSPAAAGVPSLPLEGKMSSIARQMRWSRTLSLAESMAEYVGTPHPSLRDTFPSRGRQGNDMPAARYKRCAREMQACRRHGKAICRGDPLPLRGAMVTFSRLGGVPSLPIRSLPYGGGGPLAVVGASWGHACGGRGSPNRVYEIWGFPW